jgi:trk system potassium uptake protein TrkH
MHPKAIIKQIGKILLFNSLFLFISFLISVDFDETSDKHLLISAIITFIAGLIPSIFLPKVREMKFVDGMLTVVVGWFVTCIVGMLPYLMWGHEFDFANAWFESVSGYTTTGATILTDVESLPKGLLFWRSSTHWMGGVGIVLFTILVLPQSSTERIVLLNTEISELAKRNFHYRTKKILMILVVVYVGLTFLETLFLMLAGMSFFDAINHSFSTIATGGFSTRNLSVASFNSVWVDIIIMIFMVLSGIHFGLIYNTIIGKHNNIFRSEVVKAFVVVLAVGVILVSLKLFINGEYDNIGDAFRYGAFQVISVGSTTGFANADSRNWPPFTQLIIIYFTLQCAMVGSTSGGIKFDRVYLFFKSMKKQIKLLRHPKAVINIKVDGAILSEGMELRLKSFIITYLFIVGLVTLILTFLDIDLMTSFSAAIATIGNVGPGFGEVSSLGNFHDLPNLAKYVLAFNMLVGRWEIYSFIALFTFDYWKS